MTLPGFDPSKMAHQPVSRAALPSDAPISVSALAARIARAIDDGLPARVRVVGEVGNCKRSTHWYFTLRDEKAVISAAIWGNKASKSRFEPRDGLRVIATGHVDYYAKTGRITLIVDALEPVGEGPLDARKRALIEELRALGWLDHARKRPLPTFPRRIAVVTSRTGAALQDVLDTMKRRCPAVEVLVVDVRVQGEDAAPQVARALRALSERREVFGIDAVLLTRGGGSAEDLHAFNEREVAEAIVRCAVPVVAAIGHETDTTIADLVADERAATPTQAAVRLTPDGAALLRQVGALHRRLASDTRRRLDLERHRLLSASRVGLFADPRAAVRERWGGVMRCAADLRAAASRAASTAARRLHAAAVALERHRPAEAYARRRAMLTSADERLRRAMHGAITAPDLGGLSTRLARAQRAACAACAARIGERERTLKAFDPFAVLARGYTCTFDERGRLIRSASDARPGRHVRTRTADGEFGSIVTPRPQGGPSRPPPIDPPREPLDLFGEGG
ncbi:MAG: exodeoxyribonuclease VII large subunit [Phycisphaerales bacterium]|nr:exodeoxyribonuclease VII large subunit [Phycisphaerales bacterium]